MMIYRSSVLPAAAAVRACSSRLAGAGVAGMAVLSALGCATPADLGRIERLPEGTLPPVTEVGPAVNIQPPPLARPDYPLPLVHPHWDHGPFLPFGWHGSRCFDPLFCGRFGGASGYYRGGSRGRSGLGLHLRLF